MSNDFTIGDGDENEDDDRLDAIRVIASSGLTADDIEHFSVALGRRYEDDE